VGRKVGEEKKVLEGKKVGEGKYVEEGIKIVRKRKLGGWRRKED